MVSLQIKFNNACEAGDLSTVKSLAKEYQADSRHDNEYALRCAAANGHLDIVKYLVEEYQADACESNGFPLFVAVIGQHLDIILYLVDQGAEYDFLQDDEDLLHTYNQITEHIENKKQTKQQQLQQRNTNLVKDISAHTPVRRRCNTA